jgi:hypothetical protein
MPDVNGEIYYYIEASDEWGNTVSSGDPSAPHRISITNAPVDLGAVAVWGILFASIGLIYLDGRGRGRGELAKPFLFEERSHGNEAF